MTTKIEYVHGDLLDAPEYIIVHGCNAKGVMGSGVAKAIKEKYPQAFKHYKKYIDWRTSDPERSIPVETGDIVSVKIDETRMVINAITQYNYGRDKKVVYVDYDGVRRACVNIRNICKHLGKDIVAMPAIGCGLANGDWLVVSKIIEQELCNHNIKVKVYVLDDLDRQRLSTILNNSTLFDGS